MTQPVSFLSSNLGCAKPIYRVRSGKAIGARMTASLQLGGLT
jgi:hypothetical protein